MVNVKVGRPRAKSMILLSAPEPDPADAAAPPAERPRQTMAQPPPTFIFDVVVTNLEAKGVEISDPKRLAIDVNFNRMPLTLTSSRINVNEFKPGSGLEFQTTPKNLRKTIEECGMTFVVKYMDRPVGNGQISFPAMVTERIDTEMSDIIHVDTCLLGKAGEPAGQLEMLCRLVIRCDDQPKVGESECKRNMDKSINPQDIMFVMGESQHCPSPSPCDPCLDALDSEPGDERLRLDLQRYRSQNAGTFDPNKMMTDRPSGIPACCELKKMAVEYEQLIDSITRATGSAPPPKPPCRNPEEFDMSPCRDTHMPVDMKMPGEPHLPCFTYLPNRQNRIPMPIADCDGKKPEIKPIRFCPVCLTNMSWMPKFASCPKCGIKPIPVIEERHKEKKLTADQILLEFLGKPPPTIDDYCVDPCDKAVKDKEAGGTDECPPCRCTCKFGKLCAHCRIRKLCADIFKSDKVQAKCPKVEPQPTEDFCVVNKSSSEDCRPYLAKVFSELRDLYDIKDTKKMSEFDENCELKKNKEEEPKTPDKDDRKNVPKEKMQAPRKPLHVPSCAKQPTNSRTVTGRHKHCVRQPGGVSRNHGWAWSSSYEARKMGWRPGAIRRPIKKLMKFFLLDSTRESAFQKCKTAEAEELAKELQQPVLNVCKKNGEIFVTLRPLSTLGMRQKPITFRVVKSELAVALRQLKRILKEKGFRKCTCRQTLMMCTCRNTMEKQQLFRALNKECQRHCIAPCADQLILTDTSESDLEFNFDVTPPAGTEQPYRRPKTRTGNRGTQTSKKDKVPPPPKYPAKQNPYWRAYNCAAGDRYVATAFGSPGENVFEDGLFGWGGGGPHGASAQPGGRPKPPGIWGSAQGGPMPAGPGGASRGGRGGAAGGGGGGAGGGGGGATGWKGFPKGVAAKVAAAAAGGGLKGTLASVARGGGAGGAGGGGGGGPIPVRMPQRYIKAQQQAANAEKEMKQKEVEKKKKGVDMMKYLQKTGALSKPWNPADGKGPKGKQSGPVLGPDGLTDAQRKRRALLEMPPPPLDSITRRGKPFDPCAAYYCGYYC
ncbi:uncharacterized protein LOC117897823 [Drosophila subobscura]|uniref:uncharacterized protein LOC117897823 n=1 Tax=Drosophila subobscura TaxID=7241 RepID=UPI00155B0628|nr:uncharacterized protein LOC117897823 [Drosophila subobscura]